MQSGRELEVVSELKIDDRTETVGIPKQIVINDKAKLFDRRIWKALKYPVIAKPLVADGSAKSHKMALVYNHEGLNSLKPPVVVQELVNHGGVIFKVYVIGERVRCVKRKSLPDVEEEELMKVWEDLWAFSQFSNLASDERIDDKYYKMMHLDDAEMPPLSFVTQIDNHDSNRVHGVPHTLQKEDLELERELKLINKSPVKSIHTKYGYIVDCIDIYKQPAFDHPLLKNHKLQRKPSFQNSFEKTSVENSSTKFIFGLEKDECPRGSVPIRRTTKDNLIQSKLLSNDHVLLENNPGVHVAEVYLPISFGPYYKVSGTNSIYNPQIKTKDQLSFSHMWVRKGPIDTRNEISFGWHVAPRIYGDSATYIFAAWTSDNFKKTGCYNVHCSGFVQTDPAKYLGSIVDKTSTYGGEMIEHPMSITLNDNSDCFGVDYYGDLGNEVGYSLQFGGPGGDCRN
ncbi:uncharacterized protein LOC106763348 [Vigna radiata var. radiata]|uniref:Uncharacterized protein LOC106763348 n=1 Tax=Vigna radiata var. radiata TaxID=3916 RepID=A0A1S3UAH4_VIGRR|nr:uncharacterized protein LOC106763348 [Vigna radiata var. radiata]